MAVPSTPADAAGLMLAAIKDEYPVVFLEHKLFSDKWLGFMGYGGRKTVQFDVPVEGRMGKVPGRIKPIELGKAQVKLPGDDITMISVGVGVHRCLESAGKLKAKDIAAEVIDLRSIAPLDREIICASVKKTNHLLVVDEDYEQFGLSGEIAAVCLEAGLQFQYGRVCTEETIPYSRKLEDQVLPNVERITDMALRLVKN